jgi:eukaryotic-like serine/threonine-protein kinase
MSTVQLAEDTVLGRRVALKRLHQDENVRGPARLRREALIGASLTHPNLVSIFDILTTEEGDDVIVMEYVEGGTLADLLRRGKPDTAAAMRVLTGVSAALDAIHSQRIVHRDVKPGNILLGIDGSVKLADLGIAALPDKTRITTDGAVLGTFSYMAPEQLEGSRATPAADVYALAAVAFEVLSGERARNESNPVALAHAISSQPPPDLRAAWPEAPAAAADVLRRGMARKPEARPQSAGELTARLEAALEPETTARIDPPPAPARQRPAAPAAAAAAAAGAAAAGGVAGASAAGPTARPTQAPARLAARPARVPPPAPRGRRRSRRPALLLIGLALAVAAVAVVIATSSGGSGNAGTASTPKKTAGTHTHSSTGTASSSPSSSSGGSSSSSSGTSAAATSAGGSASSPVSAVESFYHLAAAHQYSSAWALADPAFRNQLGGYQSFEAGQSGDRSITFTGASVTNQSGTAATVDVKTTSVRDNGTQHCSGPVSLVHGSSGWLVDHIDINCSPAS